MLNDSAGAAVPPERADVVVVGAGVAGLACAVALAEAGAAVALLERRPFVGGRAYSYLHPALEETVDSQHVVLGCCTNFLDLVNKAGAGESIRWYDELCFLEPRAGGEARRSWIRPGAPPAPMHSAASFLRAPMLSVGDKVAIASGLARFLRGYPEDDSESFAAWLKRTGQTERAIRHFWEPVIVGALNDSFERCSVKYAGKVFYESFLRSPEGGRLGIPAAPLSEFFEPVLELARAKGVSMHAGASVSGIQPLSGGWQVVSGAQQIQADAVVLATNLRDAQQLMDGVAKSCGQTAETIPEIDRFTVSPITTVHLWFDREVTELDHAVLLDTRIQWMFHKSRIRRWECEGSYMELVISASWPELEMGREEILRPAIEEATQFFPRIREVRLLKTGVLKEARATFSVAPGMDQFRPPQKSPFPGLYVAGDWTASDWPSTMEGAVRSGRLAAGELMGDRQRFMAAELPASGLMRWISRKDR